MVAFMSMRVGLRWGILGLSLPLACGDSGRGEDTEAQTTTTATTTSTSTTSEPPTTGGSSAGSSSGGTDSGGGCQVAEDCAEGEFCAGSGNCLMDGQCEVDADCGGGLVCTMGGCAPPPPCQSDTDCEGGETCAASGECIPAGTCGVDADCPDGQVCSTQGNCIPDGACETSRDCEVGMICGADMTCEPGGMCGGQGFTAEPVKPNMLLVLDRSCSMKDKIDGSKKWDLAVAAIDQLLTTYTSVIRWGLILFPDIDKPACEQAAVPIPIGDGNEGAIQKMLSDAQMLADPWYPDNPCVTNIDTAMEQAAAEPSLVDPMTKSYVMLISDGAQAGCSAAGGDNGTEMIIGDLYTSKGVPTFVVGFGGAVDKAQLNMFASLGGTALPGDPMYYQADNAADLEAALVDIAGGLVSCSYQLGEAPPDWNEVFIFFNDVVQVPYDPTHTNGWDYDPMTNTITFYGSFCDQLKANAVWDIDVVFGCDEPIPG